MRLTPDYLITDLSEERPRANHALFEHYYKTSHHPLQAGTQSFEGKSLLWPTLPGK